MTKPLATCVITAFILSACDTFNAGSHGRIAKAERYCGFEIVTFERQQQAYVCLKDRDRSAPADEEPWLHMARSCFKNQRYGEAIVYANEALKCDPNDVDARSIAAVSGLRVASKAIADLRRWQAENGNNADNERALTKLLRSSIGESLLRSPDGDRKP